MPLVLLLQIDNQSTMQQALQNFSDALQLPVRQKVFQNVTLHSIELPGRIASITLWFAFINDFLVVSGSEALLRESVRVTLHKRSLATSQEYQTLSLSLPSQGFAKGYIKFSECADLLRNYLDQHASFLDSRRHRIRARYDMTYMLAQLSGMMWVTTSTDQGILTKSRSPLGGTVAGSLMAAWILLSWLM
jgi:hypothetical protein